MEIDAKYRYQIKDLPGSSHETVKRIISQVSPTKILDVGAGSGFIGRWITTELNGSIDTTGVDTDPQSREYSEKFYNKFHSNLGEVQDDDFDMVLMMDLIEHLSDPAAFLQNCRKLCAKQHHIVISVPNIAHFIIRLMLLVGYFPKMERGPLDKTHLQFFTISTLKELLASVNLHIKQWHYTIFPIELLVNSQSALRQYLFALAKVRSKLVNFCPSLSSYQLVVVATFDDS